MIDLHVHTSHSDGKYSAKEILCMAEKLNLSAISFCDHNVLEAYEEIKNIDVKKYFSGKIFSGIEFDIVYQEKLFHMLGYNFDIDKLNKSKYIDRSSKEDLIQIERNILEHLKSVCKKLGIKLSDDLDINSANDAANDIIKADMIKYKENNRILDELLGKDRKISFWRGHITNPNSPFFIDFTKGIPDPKEIADEIHNAGGIVVLPHVFEYKTCNNIQFLNDMYDLGILDGIECIHTKHSKENIQYLKEYCIEKNLIMTGGSDFHREENQTLGYGCFGNVEITDEFGGKIFNPISTDKYWGDSIQRKIVAIGDGHNGRIKDDGTIDPYETGPMDLEIIRLTEKEKPNFLFIAHYQTNPESEKNYYETMRRI